jgi:hypothetical protein
MSINLVVLIVIALGLQTVHPQAKTAPSGHATADDAAHATLQEAQRFFYNADYDRAAAVTDVLCAERPDDLDACAVARPVGMNTGRLADRSTRSLRMNPAHIRGRVARAWVDYIVGSSVPRGVRWVLGGGNKKRGLLAVRDVVESGDGEFFDQVEAMFAFWDMQMREHEVPGAIATASVLARDFPENRELRKFLTTYGPSTLGINPVDRAP